MESLLTSLTAFAAILVGMFIARFTLWFLPEKKLPDDSKEIIKTAAGLIATMVALIIGLLVSSSKGSYDSTNSGITQMGAKAILLYRVLMRYGPETRDLRQPLIESLEFAIERVWPSESGKPADLETLEKKVSLEAIYDKILALEPTSEAQKLQKGQALQLINDILQSRWLLIEQMQNQLPWLFIAMLILWLSILYFLFTLLSPGNFISRTALTFCALSICSGLFLILEMNRPFVGMIRASKAPLEKALQIMKQ